MAYNPLEVPGERFGAHYLFIVPFGHVILLKTLSTPDLLLKSRSLVPPSSFLIVKEPITATENVSLSHVSRERNDRLALARALQSRYCVVRSEEEKERTFSADKSPFGGQRAI